MRPAIRVTGRVVDGNDRSVAGARITLLSRGNGAGPPVETVADAAGVYTLAIDAGYPYDQASLQAGKDGFETSLLYVNLEAGPEGEVTRNLRLHPILRISAGESVELSIVSDDPLCEDGLFSWQCRRVRVASQVAGQLTVEVPNHSPPEPYFLISLASNPFDRRSSFRIPVAAGSETILDVVLNGASGQTILTTRFEPS